MAATKEKAEKPIDSDHEVWRSLKLFRKLDGQPPVIEGLDFLGPRRELILGRGNATGDLLHGDSVVYSMLYTEHNLKIAKTYLAIGCKIVIPSDPGLTLEG
jgi:hypothetical protein